MRDVAKSRTAYFELEALRRHVAQLENPDIEGKRVEESVRWTKKGTLLLPTKK